MSKEKVEKMSKGQSSREAEPYFEWEITPNKGNHQEKYVVSIFSKKFIFTKMDKLHRWIARKDVAWAKQLGVGLLSLEFMPIHPLVKEFIQGIIQFNMDMIELIVQWVPMLLTKDTVAKMLLLP